MEYSKIKVKVKEERRGRRWMPYAPCRPSPASATLEAGGRPMAWDRGYVQVYTGDGKGKTTAALGLAIRAAGAGKRVFIAQFLKGTKSGEHEALGRFQDLIRVELFGRPGFISGAPGPEDKTFARKGLAEVLGAVRSGSFDLVIMDEANLAVWYGLFSVEELLEVMESGGGRMEIVVTGRKADPRVIARADLVTEMREIKHYFTSGTRARDGIEL
jgi:cob(I)alamin adenosyltransferase